MGGRHVTLVIEGLYHKLKKVFNGYQEDRTTPPPITGDQVYN